MKIMRVAACAVAAVMASGVATSQTQESQIVGNWACSARTADSVVAGMMKYNADGTMDADVSVALDSDDGLIQLRVVTRSSWKLNADGLIEERITEAEATSGTIDGQALPEEALATFGESVPKETGTSTVEVTAKQLILVDGDGTRTICDR